MNAATDYLVIGSGASAMAFVDTILSESDATVTMIDRRAVPGGHWNDAYPFVRLHQPAEFYGVASKQLGKHRIETEGLNPGMYELSSGVEIAHYYHDLMNDVFLPSGRVRYLPLSDHAGDGRVTHLLSGRAETIDHVTLVDATFLTTSIPSTHRRQFDVGAGVACIPPNRLPHEAASHDHIAVLGGGKTGVDAVAWLVSNGYPADRISWVVPRDSWFLNRMLLQPGMDFIRSTLGSIADEYEALATAGTEEELCLALEQAGRWMRLDEDVRPTMFHAATLSEAELAAVRQVEAIHRGSRVTALDVGAMHFSETDVAMPEDTLYVDCTASAVERNVNDRTPVFLPNLINLQMIRQFQPCFSAALIAFIASNVDDQDERAQLARPSPMTDTPHDYFRGRIDGLLNQAAWQQNPSIGAWMATCRLDPITPLLAEVGPDDQEVMAILGRLAANGPLAVENLQRLTASEHPTPDLEPGRTR